MRVRKGSDVRALPDLLREKAGYFTGVGGRTYHLDGPGKVASPFASEVIDRHHLRTYGVPGSTSRSGSDVGPARRCRPESRLPPGKDAR